MRHILTSLVRLTAVTGGLVLVLAGPAAAASLNLRLAYLVFGADTP